MMMIAFITENESNLVPLLKGLSLIAETTTVWIGRGKNLDLVVGKCELSAN